MKQQYNKILILFLSATIFFVGAGVTIVDLCCSNCLGDITAINNHKDMACSDDGVTDVETDHSCCTRDETNKRGANFADSAHTDKCCRAERLSADLDSRRHLPHINQVLDSLIFYCYYVLPDQVSNIDRDILLTGYTDIIPIPPRDYLSLIRVLII